MSELQNDYFAARNYFLSHLAHIIEVEQALTSIILNNVILEIIDDIYYDFSIRAKKLVPFWIEYPPEQRGRKPKGTAIPLLELGEKTLTSHLLAKLGQNKSIIYPGLPTGGDIRFATKDVYVHLDIKLTGPNDNPNEIVVPPNQVSGNGISWNNGIINSVWPVKYIGGKKTGQINYYFQPKLPPLYILEGRPLVCITLFLKAVYSVTDFGIQPLNFFELACVPNGLLMFDGPIYANTEGLIISGKDDKSKAESSRRVRIRLDPLSSIDSWRATKIKSTKSGWKSFPRQPY